MTTKTAEHDTVIGALRSAQDVIEGILNATQALLTSLTYPDSSTVMGAGSSPAESEAKLLLLPTRSAEKLAKELASSAKERLTLDRTAKKALRDLTTEWLGARVMPAWSTALAVRKAHKDPYDRVVNLLERIASKPDA